MRSTSRGSFKNNIVLVAVAMLFLFPLSARATPGEPASQPKTDATSSPGSSKVDPRVDEAKRLQMMQRAIAHHRQQTVRKKAAEAVAAQNMLPSRYGGGLVFVGTASQLTSEGTYSTYGYDEDDKNYSLGPSEGVAVYLDYAVSRWGKPSELLSLSVGLGIDLHDLDGPALDLFVFGANARLKLERRVGQIGLYFLLSAGNGHLFNGRIASGVRFTAAAGLRLITSSGVAPIVELGAVNGFFWRDIYPGGMAPMNPVNQAAHLSSLYISLGVHFGG